MEKKRQHISLEEINKEVSFHVPDGYFHELPSIIQSKTSAKTRNKFDLSFLFSTVSVRYVLPFAVIAVGVFMFWNTRTSSQTSITSLSDEEILNYLSVYEDDGLDIYASTSSDDIDIQFNDFIDVDTDVESLYFDTDTDDFLNGIGLEEDLSENSILLL